MDFFKITEKLWRSFFSKDWENTKKMIFENVTPECTIIGTGAHEFYTDLDSFLNSFDEEMQIISGRSKYKLILNLSWYTENLMPGEKAMTILS